MEKLVLASNNSGKIREFKKMLGDRFEIVSLKEIGLNVDVEENGKTFYENALIKAKTISEMIGENVISDDSGLCVEALNWAPGIYSARYAGDHGNDKLNRELLLKNMEGVENRTAKFCSSIVLYFSNGKIIEGYGETFGKILHKEEGNNGFGYDPIFFNDDLQMSFGLASEEAKNMVSHRYRALVDLLGKLNG